MEKLTKREKLILAGGSVLLIAVGFVFGKNKLNQSKLNNSYNKLREKYRETGTKDVSYEELKRDCRIMRGIVEDSGQNKEAMRKYMNLYDRLHHARNSKFREMNENM